MTLNWGELFGLSVPPLELVVRGSALYLFLLLIFRVVIKRRMGAIGMADILVLVIISDASQNAMAGEYTTISEGAVLVGTLIGWNVLFDWLAFRYKAFAKFVEPAPLPLMKEGKILHRNLRREFLTVDELMAKLREHGIDNLSAVKSACMEGDGEITVVRRGTREDKKPKPPRKRAV